MPSPSHVALYLVVLPILAVVGAIALGALSLALREPWTPEARLKAAKRAAAAEAPAREKERAPEPA